MKTITFEVSKSHTEKYEAALLGKQAGPVENNQGHDLA